MADIFISHSSKDTEAAAAIHQRIQDDRPTWTSFYDKEHIHAGQRWQERLREELTSCRVVLALLSRNWLESHWCFAEAVTASFRGKDVVGVETETLTSDDLALAPPILHERQRVRLRGGDNRAWQEILGALDRSGLDPDDWFPRGDVGPYPGLVAFDEKDAGVFFGRKQEITDYLGILDTLRGPDRPQVLVISGSSGCGKSSLLRAGLIPRLRRKKRDWVVISPFEVAREPVRNLLDRISEALTGLDTPMQGLDLTSIPDAKTLAQLVEEALRRLERATGAWVLLPLDQAEAIVAAERQASDEPKLLLDVLAQVLGGRTRQVVVAATIRTEFVPRLEEVFAGTEVSLRQAPLSAISSFAEVIEKPAERFAIELESGLTERIIEDVHTADALPLLAYTLKALDDRDGADRRLTLDGYRALGGVRGAIGAALELVLSYPEPTAEELWALRCAFTRQLIRVDEAAVEGERLLRRVVDRARLPRAADRLIDRLVDARLLISKNGTIELAHERVIDDWPKLPLRTWLAQDATDRRLIDQLRHHVNGNDWLRGGLLAQAEELLRRDPEIRAQEPALAKLVHRSRWRRRFIRGGTLLVLLSIVSSAGFAWMQNNEARNQRDKAHTQRLATQARRAVEAGTPDDIGRAGALALESIWIAREKGLPEEADAIETARSASIHLPLVVLSQGSQVLSLTALSDGRLVSGGEDGKIHVWPRDGAGEPEVYSHGSAVHSLAVLADARLASGGEDGQIKIWSKDGSREERILPHGSPISSLAVLADGRLASGGDDGQIKLWPKGATRDPEVLPHGSQVLSLAALPDGRLASGGADGEIRIWPKDGTAQPVILSHGSQVRSLTVLADGRLASGGVDGNVKLWPKDGSGEPEVLSQGSSVGPLAVLANGRLASGDDDGRIKLWPIAGAEDQAVLPHGGQVLSLAVLPDGQFASGGVDGEIKLWPKGGTSEPVILSHDSPVLSLAAFPDGRLATGGGDGSIRVWPKDSTGDPVVLSHGSQVRVSALAVLTDGRLASAGNDKAGTIKLWPKGYRGEVTVFSHGSPVTSLAALRDGRLASGGEDGKIKLWSTEGRGEPVVLPHSSPVNSLAVLADGRLASADAEGNIKLWPKHGTAEPIVHFHGRPGVSSLAALAAGVLASGGYDGNVKLWPNERAGEPVVLSHGSPVLSLAVLADGRLASGGEDGKIELWPKEGKGVPVVLSHGDRGVLSLALLADGWLASGGADGRIKLWRVDEQELIRALCLRVGRNLKREDEWAGYIGSDTLWRPSCRNFPSNWRTPERE